MRRPDEMLHQRYRIVQQIGRGGMGSVYQAIDTRLDKTVAIKETVTDDARIRDAFMSEARLLASLRHPALPDVSDYFTEHGSQFLVMEYITGTDLATLLEQRGAAFPLDQVLAWANELLDVLDYLHTRQPPIVHRDIKPQNIKFTPEGQLYLLDFGLAKGAEGTLMRGYTVHYASPEQIQLTSTDARSDLFSLAVTLHHLLTNSAPLGCTTRMAALAMKEQDPQPPAYRVNEDVPRAVSNVLDKAMALRPDERYASAREMQAALHNARNAMSSETRRLEPLPAEQPPVMPPTPTLAVPPPPSPPPHSSEPPPSAPRTSSSRARVVLGGLLVVVLLLGGGLAAWAFVGTDPDSSSPTDIPPADPPATADALDNQIVFVSNRNDGRGLYVMDADGTNVTRLTEPGTDAAAPAVAPDGTRVAFVSEGDIYVINADGSGLRRLTEGGDATAPTWAPDSTRVAFAQGDHMYILPVDNSDDTPNQLPGPPGNYRNLHWCPQDGDNRLLFVLGDDIFTISSSGGTRANLTRSDGASYTEPVWSPDCEQIAFASDEDGDWDIYVMQADGGNRQRLVNDDDRPRLDRWPTWSPDGQRIAFRSFRTGNQEIYVMQADGSDPTPLTDNGAEDTAPAWSP